MESSLKDIIFIVNPRPTVVNLDFLYELICCPLLDLRLIS
jgi:hypothetical protein